jgi:hypothetical protein
MALKPAGWGSCPAAAWSLDMLERMLYDVEHMTHEATLLLDAAVKRVGLHSGFSPAEIGQGIGLDKDQATAAARQLSSSGILELGFDCSANFSSAYIKLRAKSLASVGDRPTGKKPAARKKPV